MSRHTATCTGISRSVKKVFWVTSGTWALASSPPVHVSVFAQLEPKAWACATSLIPNVCSFLPNNNNKKKPKEEKKKAVTV